MPPRFIARQLSCPTGFFGGVMGLLMNRHNAKMNRFAVRKLELMPTDRVLEIGFWRGCQPTLSDCWRRVRRRRRSVASNRQASESTVCRSRISESRRLSRGQCGGTPL
jgi:hypothetical protein